jgi:hypothetical protein
MKEVPKQRMREVTMIEADLEISYAILHKSLGKFAIRFVFVSLTLKHH